MIYNYIQIRTLIVFVITAFISFFIFDYRVDIALLISLIISPFSVLITLILRHPIERALINRIAQRNKKKIGPQTSATENDEIIRLFDFYLAMAFPWAITYFAVELKSYTTTFEAILYSPPVQIIFISVCFLYYSCLLFILRKNLFVAYTVFALVASLCGGLLLFRELLQLSDLSIYLIEFFVGLMAIYFAIATILYNFDAKVQELENSKTKVYWNKLIKFLSWDFLLKK